MKLSILIPTYNYAKYIPQALQSVLDQDFADFELIVSDDASTDITTEVVLPFLKQDSRIRYERHANNLGMVNNWNWCLHQAKGEYVYFLFADDFLLGPNALAEMVAALDDHPDAVMSVSPRMIVNEDGKLLWRASDLGMSGYYNGHEVIGKCWDKVANLIGEPSVVMMRRHVVSRGFSSSFKQLVDLEMWIHCLKQGGLFFLAIPQVAFRQHSLQQTVVNNGGGDTLLEMYCLFEMYKNELMASGRKRRTKLMHYESIYRVIHDLKRSNRNSPDVLAAILALENEIPEQWWIPTKIAYRLIKFSKTICRSVRKRIFINRFYRYKDR